MILALCAILAVVFLLWVLWFVGRRLELFSPEYLAEKAAGVHHVLHAMYPLVGMIWFFSKLRIPGIEALLTYGLDNRIGFVLRSAYWKARLGSLGKNVRIDIGARFIRPRFMKIGDYSWIDRYAILAAGGAGLGGFKIIARANANYQGGVGELAIGRYCHIGPYSLIQAAAGVELGECSSIAAGAKVYSVSNHIRNPTDASDKTVYKWSPTVPRAEQLLVVGPVVLRNNSGLGINAVVLPGVTVYENSLVAVNSLALHDVPPNTIAKGNPIVPHPIQRRSSHGMRWT